MMTSATEELSDRDETENENERGEGHISGTKRVDFHLFLQEHSELEAGA